MLFDTTYKAVTTIVNNIEKYKSNSIDDALPYLADLNIEQRLKGLNADGQLITPGLRSEAYANAKKSRGGRALFGTPDLKDTGDFNSGQYAKKSGKMINFGSTDDKNSDLIAKYGEKIHGLTEESREEALADQLIPFVIYEIDQQIKTI